LTTIHSIHSLSQRSRSWWGSTRLSLHTTSDSRRISHCSSHQYPIQYLAHSRDARRWTQDATPFMTPTCLPRYFVSYQVRISQGEGHGSALKAHAHAMHEFSCLRHALASLVSVPAITHSPFSRTRGRFTSLRLSRSITCDITSSWSELRGSENHIRFRVLYKLRIPCQFLILTA